MNRTRSGCKEAALITWRWRRVFYERTSMNDAVAISTVMAALKALLGDARLIVLSLERRLVRRRLATSFEVSRPAAHNSSPSKQTTCFSTKGTFASPSELGSTSQTLA